MNKNKKSFPVKPVLLLSASALLLLGSTIGSTRAALTYYSENYSVQMNMSSIGVTLMENGEPVSYSNYTDGGKWEQKTDAKLLDKMLGGDSKLTPGKKYDESLSVRNSGNIDTFVRVIITKSWQDENGKATNLSPDLIELNLTGNGWEKANVGSSPERMVLYYTQALPAGETTPELSDTIRIDNEIAEKVSKEVSEDGKTIRYVYDYDGYTFNLDAEVNAVQTNNAQEAIKSAWGVDVSVASDETSLSLQ